MQPEKPAQAPSTHHGPKSRVAKAQKAWGPPQESPTATMQVIPPAEAEYCSYFYHYPYRHSGGMHLRTKSRGAEAQYKKYVIEHIDAALPHRAPCPTVPRPHSDT